MVSEGELRAIKERIDIVELVQADLHLKKSGQNYFARCPFHSERTPSFSVNAAKGFYHCFSCGAHGDAIDWMVNYRGMPWHEAVARLAHQAGVAIAADEEGEHSRIRAKAEAAAVLEHAARWLHQRFLAMPRVVAYATDERHLTPRTCTDFMLGAAPRVVSEYLREFPSRKEEEALVQAGLLGRGEAGRLYPKLAGRLIFPLRDAVGWVVGFAGRTLAAGVQPKYMNSPESPFFSKRHEIFRAPGVHQAAHAASCVVAVEGYMDVMALYQAGIGYAVAGMGTAITPEQLQSMFALSAEVVICLDGDKAGQAAAWRALVTALSVVGDNRLATFMFLPDSQDPDEFVAARGAAAFERLVAEAVPLSRFFIDTWRARVRGAAMERRGALLKEAAEQVALVHEHLLRSSLAAALAEVFSVDVADVCRAGDFRTGARVRAMAAVPGMPAGAVEEAFLAALLHKPWLAGSALAPDVELATPGGTEIVRALASSDFDAAADAPHTASSVLAAFHGEPFAPMVQRLLAHEVAGENVLVLGKQVEQHWLHERLEQSVSAGMPSAADAEAFSALAARRFSVMRELARLQEAFEPAAVAR